MGFDLKSSYAYGNSAQDTWLLDEVGNPWAVNPAPGLSRAAREKNWPILWWNAKTELTQKPQRAQRTQRRVEGVTTPGSLV
jgi:phosphoserine phosphatase